MIFFVLLFIGVSIVNSAPRNVHLKTDSFVTDKSKDFDNDIKGHDNKLLDKHYNDLLNLFKSNSNVVENVVHGIDEVIRYIQSETLNTNVANEAINNVKTSLNKLIIVCDKAFYWIELRQNSFLDSKAKPYTDLSTLSEKITKFRTTLETIDNGMESLNDILIDRMKFRMRDFILNLAYPKYRIRKQMSSKQMSSKEIDPQVMDTVLNMDSNSFSISYNAIIDAVSGLIRGKDNAEYK